MIGFFSFQLSNLERLGGHKERSFIIDLYIAGTEYTEQRSRRSMTTVQESLLFFILLLSRHLLVKSDRSSIFIRYISLLRIPNSYITLIV